MWRHPTNPLEGEGCRASRAGGGRPNDHGAEPKFDRSPLDGPSITHSTELRRALLEDCVVWNEAFVVLFVSLRTKLPEDEFVTSAVNESPACTATPKVTRLLGYISYQA